MTARKKTTIVIKAIELSRTIDTKGVISVLGKHHPIVSLDPVLINVYPGRKQYLLIAKYGVIALINNSETFEQKALTMIQPFLEEPLPVNTSDEMKVVIDPASANKVLFDRVVVRNEDEDYWKILGMLLSQSVGLESYEKKVDQILDDFSVRLKKLSALLSRVFYPKISSIIRSINEAISLHQDIIANLEILDKPELTWEKVDLDNLYRSFSDMLEVPERISVLEKKLDLLKDNMEAALNIASTRRMEILEWVIIVLIALSILQGLLGLY